MKKSCAWFVVIILLYFSVPLSAQVIKVENGIAITSTKYEDDSFDTRTPYQVSLGIDYLHNKWYNLSSEIGYITKGSGGKVNFLFNPGENTPYDHYTLSANYITINTTFRLKGDIRKEIYYIGVGPRVDIKVKDDIHELADYMSAKSILYGLKCEIGGIYKINDDILIGLNASYLPSFNKQFGELRERTFTLGLSIGYRLH